MESTSLCSEGSGTNHHTVESRLWSDRSAFQLFVGINRAEKNPVPNPGSMGFYECPWQSSLPIQCVMEALIEKSPVGIVEQQTPFGTSLFQSCKYNFFMQVTTFGTHVQRPEDEHNIKIFML